MACDDDTMDDRPILFVLPNGGRGGMQSQVALVAAEFARRGRAVTVATGGGGSAIDGVTTRELPTLSARSAPKFLRELRRISREHVVHGHGLRLAPFVGASGGSVNVVTCHGLDPAHVRGAVGLAKFGRASLVSCGEGPQRLLAAHGVASRVINNALGDLAAARTLEECRQEFQLVPEVPVIVYPARFSAQKNHLGLAEAMAMVRDELGDRSPELVCVGDGPLFEQAQQRARTDGRPLLRCFAHRDDAASWVGASSFFVLPSRWEGQPLVVLEAFAYGKSVVTSTAVGVEDLVFDGRNGKTVTSMRALSDVIVEWCRQPERVPFEYALRNELLQRHSLDTVIGEHEALYRELDPH
jgi:glycosyltransferase involved in cell wall biosynthesis